MSAILFFPLLIAAMFALSAAIYWITRALHNRDTGKRGSLGAEPKSHDESASA